MIDLNLGSTTIMMILFFGTNAVLFALFQIISYYSNMNNASKSHDSPAKKDKDHAAKELSKPFVGTVDCFHNITTEFFRTGLIMAITYICEKHWIFEHSGKTYSRDLFMFILIVFFAYGFYTIKPVHDLTLLSREQTEEWKGWMQFIFLLYHYFHAEEVYNSVRVMITCYVWMTGFGNFQFFYVKQDFGWLRVVQMLWRLNFSVLLLMWTHGNTWILYYICPMHTFYFAMVYFTMYIFSSVNHSKWGIRLKLFLVGVLIYIVWDINRGLFDFVFSWLGTDSVIGATNGSVWEYYFRTSLDHWSSFLGMIFAINFPLAEQYFHKAKGGPLLFAAVVMAIASTWWLTEIYSLPKLDYNLVHSYYAIIPLTAYIFFRNITPWIRSGVSMSLHDLGKTTLETYLLQHHVWLTSNAKTLLTIVPGHPWINFALATMLFFFLSKELYRLTMSLRGMVLPEDKNIAFNNGIGLTIIFGLLYVISIILTAFHPTMLEIMLACVGLALVSLLIISRFATQTADNHSFQFWSKRFALILLSLLCIGVFVQVSDSSSHDHNASNRVTWASTRFNVDTDCLKAISIGHWNSIPCPPATSSLNRKAFCETDEWVWDAFSAECPVANIPSARAKVIFKGKKIVFIGDSIVRNTYHQLNRLLDSKYSNTLMNATYRHASLQQNFPGNTSVSFIWAPMVENATDYLRSAKLSNKRVDLLVIGATIHDALYEHDINVYVKSVHAMRPHLPSNNQTVKIWLQPTKIVDGRLTSFEKQYYMNEEVVARYRDAFVNLPGIQADKLGNPGAFHVLVDPTLASAGKETGSADGVHYGEDVYSVMAQVRPSASA
jgi:N-acetylneuraminate 9-O-acetyltransferase